MWLAVQSLPTLRLCDSELWLRAVVSTELPCHWRDILASHLPLSGPRKALGRSVAAIVAGRLWMRISEMVTLWGCREVEGEISNLPLGFMGRTGVARYSPAPQAFSKASLVQGALTTTRQSSVSLHLGWRESAVCQCHDPCRLGAGLNSHGV